MAVNGAEVVDQVTTYLQFEEIFEPYISNFQQSAVTFVKGSFHYNICKNLSKIKSPMPNHFGIIIMFLIPANNFSILKITY